MPRKKIVGKKVSKSSLPNEVATSNLKLKTAAIKPPVTKSASFTDNKWVAMLVDNFGTILLVVAAFLIGMLFTEVRYLKKGDSPAVAQAPTAGQAQQPAAAPQTGPLSDDLWNQLLSTKPAMEVGSKTAKVTMVEFTDYQCPFCSQYYNQSYKALSDLYVKTGKMRVLVYDYPLPFHPNARPAALFARCVGEDGKYELVHNMLFEKQNEWVNLTGDALTQKFQSYAQAVGSNADKATSCLKDARYGTVVDASQALGTKVGVNGTPTFIINKELVVGAQPTDAFKTVIEKYLK